jgi:hypothetical protein
MLEIGCCLNGGHIVSSSSIIQNFKEFLISVFFGSNFPNYPKTIIHCTISLSSSTIVIYIYIVGSVRNISQIKCGKNIKKIQGQIIEIFGN